MNIELFRNICGVISTMLAIGCSVPYIRSVLQGKTKPHQFSFMVFAIMNGLVFITQFLEGARQSVLVALVFFISTVITVVLSFSRGTRNTSSLDRTLFGFALFTIVIWVLTGSNTVAIWLTVLIDIFATTMILLKIKAEPKSEDPLPWMVAMAAFIFTCLSLMGRSVSIIFVRPFYGLASSFVVAWYIFYHRKKGKALAHETTTLMQ